MNASATGTRACACRTLNALMLHSQAVQASTAAVYYTWLLRAPESPVSKRKTDQHAVCPNGRYVQLCCIPNTDTTTVKAAE